MLVAVCLVGAALCAPARAQSVRGQSTLAFTVAETTDFEVEGAPQVTISGLDSWTESADGAASYSLVTNKGTPKDITISLDQAPPPGLAFEAYVEAPASNGRGATSAGWTALDTDEQVVVQNVQKVNDSGVPISYRARASAETAPDTYVLTVNYTISAAN